MMSDVQPRRLLRALGLDPREVRLLDVLRVPSTGRELRRGFVTSSRLHSPVAQSEALLPELEGWRGARLSISEPGVIELESPFAPVATSGAVRMVGADRWSLDGRYAPAGAVFGRYAVLVLATGLRVCRIDFASGQRSLERDPIIAEVLGARVAPKWLLIAAEDLLDEPGTYPAATAAGLLGRFWTPPRDATAAIEELLAGEGPALAAQRWFAALPERKQRQAEDSACTDAERLQGDLGRLERMATRSDDAVRPQLERWALGRDDLECFAFLYGQEREGTDVALALRSLDSAARSYLSLFALAASDEPRLAMVARDEPDLWWGQLAAARH
jgi:hypothetical protein